MNDFPKYATLTTSQYNTLAMHYGKMRKGKMVGETLAGTRVKLLRPFLDGYEWTANLADDALGMQGYLVANEVSNVSKSKEV